MEPLELRITEPNSFSVSFCRPMRGGLGDHAQDKGVKGSHQALRARIAL